MSTVIKNKLPAWLWIVIIGSIIIVSVLTALHFIGYINLGFLGDYFLSYYAWGGQSIINGLIAITLPIAAGALLGYGIISFKGMKLSKNTAIQTSPTTLQGAPIQQQAFQQAPTPVILENQKEN